MADVLSLIGDAVASYAYIGGGDRYIGTIIPDVVVREVHDDEMMVTDHPVETGAAVSDHAFMLPQRLEIQVGSSDGLGQSEGYVQAVYDDFLSLQKQRSPFSVGTGKRTYSNMLIRGLHVETDATTETALNLTVALRQVIRVSTSSTNSAVSNVASNLGSAQQTLGSTDSGTLTLNVADTAAPSFAGTSSINAFASTYGGIGNSFSNTFSTGSPTMGSAGV